MNLFACEIDLENSCERFVASTKAELVSVPDDPHILGHVAPPCRYKFRLSFFLRRKHLWTTALCIWRIHEAIPPNLAGPIRDGCVSRRRETIVNIQSGWMAQSVPQPPEHDFARKLAIERVDRNHLWSESPRESRADVGSQVGFPFVFRHRLEKFRTGCQEVLEDADVKRDREVLFGGRREGPIPARNHAQSIGEVRLNLIFGSRKYSIRSPQTMVRPVQRRQPCDLFAERFPGLPWIAPFPARVRRGYRAAARRHLVARVGYADVTAVRSGCESSSYKSSFQVQQQVTGTMFGFLSSDSEPSPQGRLHEWSVGWPGKKRLAPSESLQKASARQLLFR